MGALVGWGVYEANRYADRRARQRAFENVTSYRDSRSYYNTKTDKKKKKTGGAFPDRPLPRDEHGNPVADSSSPHSQLGTYEGRKGTYPQAREFDAQGKAVRDIDFTDHGRPHQHTNPHQHVYVENETGGTPRRDDAEPLWSCP